MDEESAIISKELEGLGIEKEFSSSRLGFCA